MTDIALHPFKIVLGRTTRWVRIVLVSFAVLALTVLSFVVGRATMGHAATTTVRPVIVQHVDPPAGVAPASCRVHLPC
jgi:hypothetical protein